MLVTITPSAGHERGELIIDLFFFINYTQLNMKSQGGGGVQRGECHFPAPCLQPQGAPELPLLSLLPSRSIPLPASSANFLRRVPEPLPCGQAKSSVYPGRSTWLNTPEQQETMGGNLQDTQKQQGWRGTTPSCSWAPKSSVGCPRFSSHFLGGNSSTRNSD